MGSKYQNYMLTFDESDYGGEMLQPALRGMFGMQNKEEAVNTILEGADYSTPESRRVALDQIRSIDPARWATLNKQNQDYETQELGLKAKYGEPALKQAWTKTQVPALTSKWALDNLAFYDLTGAIEALGHQPTTDTDITNILVWLAKNDDDLPSGKAGMLKTSYTSMLKSKKADYLLLNKYNPPGSTKGTQTRDLNSIQGRGERTVTPPATVPITSAQPANPLPEVSSPLNPITRKDYL